MTARGRVASPSRGARATGRSRRSCMPSRMPRRSPADRARRGGFRPRRRGWRRATGRRPADRRRRSVRSLRSPQRAHPRTGRADARMRATSSLRRSSVTRNAVANATMPATFCVPARRPRSCPPPSTSGTSGTSSRTTRAPTPFGPPNLWPEMATRSARAAASRRSHHCGACTASVWNAAFGARSRTSVAMSASGWRTPVSLLTSITDTTAVRSSSAPANASRSTTPDACRPDPGDPEALPREAVAGAEHGLVLDAGADDAVEPRHRAAGGPCRALDREVVALAAAAGEHDLVRPGAAHRGDGLTCFFERGLRGAGGRVRPRRVGGVVGEERQHRVDRLGPHRRRCRMVEVHAHDNQATAPEQGDCPCCWGPSAGVVVSPQGILQP